MGKFQGVVHPVLGRRTPHNPRLQLFDPARNGCITPGWNIFLSAGQRVNPPGPNPEG
jgi:hypothetical protein